MLYVICIFSLESWNKNKRASFKKKKKEMDMIKKVKQQPTEWENVSAN